MQSLRPSLYQMSAQASNPNINIMVYNAFLRPSLLFSDGQAERAMAIANMLVEKASRHGLDCIVLCEAFDTDARQMCVDHIVRHSDFKHTTNVLSGHKLSLRLNGGVVVLSRHRFLRIEHQLFRWSELTGADSLAEKGFEYVSFVKDGLDVCIIATHMQAWDDMESAKMRRLEACVIRKFIDAVCYTSMSSRPVVFVCGDLNHDTYNHESDRLSDASADAMAGDSSFISSKQSPTPQSLQKSRSINNQHHSKPTPYDSRVNDLSRSREWVTLLDILGAVEINDRNRCNIHCVPSVSRYNSLAGRDGSCAPFSNQRPDHVVLCMSRPRHRPVDDGLRPSDLRVKTASCVVCDDVRLPETLTIGHSGPESLFATRRKVEITDLSDHYPVIASIVFNI